MSLDLTLSSLTGNEPASIQWTLTYPSSDILAITVASGPAATAAGKSIACGGGGGSYMCLLTGINANVIPNGVVAVVSVTVSSAAVSPTISIANPLGASSSGNGIPMTGTGGTITVMAAQPMSLHALTCNPSTLKTPTTSVCTVTLNQTASSNTSVWLSDDSAALMIPASIAVSAGSSSATFTAAASTVTATENAVITATLDTSTRTASLTLSPPLTLSSLVCNPSSLVSGSTSTCTITLNQTAPSTVNVSLSNSSAALTLPASVTVSAGSSSALFTVTAGTVIAAESTMITATFGGSSVNATLSLGNGLVAAFGFDEGTGTMVNDVSGRGNAGIIQGATWTIGGRFGRALSFDGTNDWVTVNDSDSLDLTTGMTLEAWVNPKTLGTFWRTVVFKELSGGLSYSLYANSGSNKRPSGYIRLNGGEQDSGTEGTTVVPANTWTHLATTYDGATLRLFVNGVLVRSTIASGAIRASTGVLRIGGNAVSSKDYFKGLIDEVRIYTGRFRKPRSRTTWSLRSARCPHPLLMRRL